jgi:hypothetical protein
MRKLSLVLGAVLITAGTFLLVRHGQAQPDLDSLVVCRNTQKLIFENAFVRVIDDVIPPGVSEPKHRHPHGVVIALEDADIETRTYPGGQPIRHRNIKGNATWNEAYVHDVKNVGTTTSHVIRIDLK